MTNLLTNIRRTAGLFLVSSAVVFSTAGTCSSGGGGNSAPKRACYTFSSVSLNYDFRDEESNLIQLASDAIDLGIAHNIDGTKYVGKITNLSDILRNRDNYPVERQPEIKITFKLQAEPDDEYICQPSDVGDLYIDNLPNHGTHINTLIVSVKSIVTEKNKLQLCWSKSFDLNQQLWDSLSDKSLSTNAIVNINAYTKCVGLKESIFARVKPEGYVVAAYSPALEAVPGEVALYADNELIITTPTLKKPIYINGGYSNQVQWNEPVLLIR